jgi:hypothetical protein
MTKPHTGANSTSEAPELEEKYEGLLHAGFVVPPKDFSINIVNQLTENQQIFVPSISAQISAQISAKTRTKISAKIHAKTAEHRPISFYFRCVAMACASALTAIEVFTFLFSFWAANTAL